MDVHPTKNISIGIDPYPYIYLTYHLFGGKTSGSASPAEPRQHLRPGGSSGEERLSQVEGVRSHVAETCGEVMVKLLGSVNGENPLEKCGKPWETMGKCGFFMG